MSLLVRRFALFLVLWTSPAWGWGFDGHRRLASMLHEPLPSSLCLRQWLAARQTAALQDSACDPDRWRYPSAGAEYDPNEWPNHYLEIDWTNPLSSYPRTWTGVEARFGASALRNGRVPFRVEEMAARLVDDFRSKDSQRILTTVFLLSHYVTDAFSVLHDTRNFDPNGLHSRWESDMLNAPTRRDALAAAAVGWYGTPGRADPRHNVFDIVAVGNGLLAPLMAFDEANPNDLAGLFNASKDLTARRWGDALTVLSSIVWTAWADAGAPELSGFSSNCSRATPSEEVVLQGYPVPGGFTHPADPGNDAGQGGGAQPGEDAGAGGGGGAQSTEDAGPGTGGPKEVPCGCASTGGAGTALWAALLLLARRSQSVGALVEESADDAPPRSPALASRKAWDLATIQATAQSPQLHRSKRAPW